MKKILNFLSRYLKCLYDFNLFKKYFEEKTYLAVLFVIPILLIFAVQNYIGAITPLKNIADSFDGYYDVISNVKYDKIIDFTDTLSTGSGPSDTEWDVSPSDSINISFDDGNVILDQQKPLQESFEMDGLTYSIIIDTNNELEIEMKTNSKYSDEDISKMNFNVTGVATYVTKDYALIFYKGNIMPYDFTSLSGKYDSTEEIYHFLKNNYVNRKVMVSFALLAGLFLFTLYYVVVYFTAKSAMKRNEFELSKNRTFKVSLYSMPAGAYAYLILNYTMKQSQLALSFLVPIISMFAMIYVTTKTLDNVKEYVKKEEKKEKKKKNREKNTWFATVLILCYN